LKFHSSQPALLCAREDSNLHPVKPGQGPQPCPQIVRCVRCVHLQRFGPEIWTIWMQASVLDVVKVLSEDPWVRSMAGTAALLAADSEASWRTTTWARRRSRASCHSSGKKGKKRVLTLGSASFSVPSGRTGRMTITLSKAARGLLAKKRTLKALEIVVAHDARGLSRPAPRRSRSRRLEREGANKTSRRGDLSLRISACSWGVRLAVLNAPIPWVV
jgi:hypothetical protein